MEIPFHKYHGTGNDFVLIDNRQRLLSGEENAWFAAICHRRFGIGADGVILLNPHPAYDFEMDYFNSDGHRSSMCGNGGRCIAQFARDLGIVTRQASFLAPDGPHVAHVEEGLVRLQMGMPTGYQLIGEGDHWVHTGSPHFVRFVQGDVSEVDVVSLGRSIRWSQPWGAVGTNVNFVQVLGLGHAAVRTYERGVEDETWSCGTGVTAVAEVLRRNQPGCPPSVYISTPGGKLAVHFLPGEAPWLEGPAQFVFQGHITSPTHA